MTWTCWRDGTVIHLIAFGGVSMCSKVMPFGSAVVAVSDPTPKAQDIRCPVCVKAWNEARKEL